MVHYYEIMKPTRFKGRRGKLADLTIRKRDKLYEQKYVKYQDIWHDISMQSKKKKAILENFISRHKLKLSQRNTTFY